MFVDRKCPICGKMMKWNSKLIYHCDHCNQSFKLGTRGKLMLLAMMIVCTFLADLLTYAMSHIFSLPSAVKLIILAVLLLFAIYAESQFHISYLIFNGRELDRITT